MLLPHPPSTTATTTTTATNTPGGTNPHHHHHHQHPNHHHHQHHHHHATNTAQQQHHNHNHHPSATVFKTDTTDLYPLIDLNPSTPAAAATAPTPPPTSHPYPHNNSHFRSQQQQQQHHHHHHHHSLNYHHNQQQQQQHPSSSFPTHNNSQQHQNQNQHQAHITSHWASASSPTSVSASATASAVQTQPPTYGNGYSQQGGVISHQPSVVPTGGTEGGGGDGNEVTVVVGPPSTVLSSPDNTIDIIHQTSHPPSSSLPSPPATTTTTSTFARPATGLLGLGGLGGMNLNITNTEQPQPPPSSSSLLSLPMPHITGHSAAVMNMSSSSTATAALPSTTTTSSTGVTLTATGVTGTAAGGNASVMMAMTGNSFTAKATTTTSLLLSSSCSSSSSSSFSSSPPLQQQQQQQQQTLSLPMMAHGTVGAVGTGVVNSGGGGLGHNAQVLQHHDHVHHIRPNHMNNNAVDGMMMTATRTGTGISGGGGEGAIGMGISNTNNSVDNAGVDADARHNNQHFVTHDNQPHHHSNNGHHLSAVHHHQQQDHPGSPPSSSGSSSSGSAGAGSATMHGQQHGIGKNGHPNFLSSASSPSSPSSSSQLSQQHLVQQQQQHLQHRSFPSLSLTLAGQQSHGGPTTTHQPYRQEQQHHHQYDQTHGTQLLNNASRSAPSLPGAAASNGHGGITSSLPHHSSRLNTQYHQGDKYHLIHDQNQHTRGAAPTTSSSLPSHTVTPSHPSTLTLSHAPGGIMTTVAAAAAAAAVAAGDDTLPDNTAVSGAGSVPAHGQWIGQASNGAPLPQLPPVVMSGPSSPSSAAGPTAVNPIPATTLHASSASASASPSPSASPSSSLSLVEVGVSTALSGGGAGTTRMHSHRVGGGTSLGMGISGRDVARSNGVSSDTGLGIGLGLMGGGGCGGDLTKPINALGPLCFSGFYLVTLTRTLIRNRMIPHSVRAVFLAPQLHFGFTVRDGRDLKWRNVHTGQIPYGRLVSAGDWIRRKLGIPVSGLSVGSNNTSTTCTGHSGVTTVRTMTTTTTTGSMGAGAGTASSSPSSFTFKQVKDALQKAISETWADATWSTLVNTLYDDFDGTVDPKDVDDALHSEGVCARAASTPPMFFRRVNCHKDAPDIRRDVEGAVAARECLRTVLQHLGLQHHITGHHHHHPQKAKSLYHNSNSSNNKTISIARFRDQIFPLWKRHCPYVAQHDGKDCCRFYSGGYFKKMMFHKHLYSVAACTSSYHVKDIFEGLDEVIKVGSNPTGMCVREAKCAAGLRYNVDKSFQSGIRSYSKAKFVEAAPHTAAQFVALDRQLRLRITGLADERSALFPKCRPVLRQLVSNALGGSGNSGGGYSGGRIGDDGGDTVGSHGIGGGDGGGGGMPTVGVPTRPVLMPPDFLKQTALAQSLHDHARQTHGLLHHKQELQELPLIMHDEPNSNVHGDMEIADDARTDAGGGFRFVNHHNHQQQPEPYYRRDPSHRNGLLRLGSEMTNDMHANTQSHTGQAHGRMLPHSPVSPCSPMSLCGKRKRRHEDNGTGKEIDIVGIGIRAGVNHDDRNDSRLSSDNRQEPTTPSHHYQQHQHQTDHVNYHHNHNNTGRHIPILMPLSLSPMNGDDEACALEAAASAAAVATATAAPAPSTPREQKRKHAHLSLKRKEEAEQQAKQYLEHLRAECQRLQRVYEAVKRHGETCRCAVGGSTSSSGLLNMTHDGRVHGNFSTPNNGDRNNKSGNVNDHNGSNEDEGDVDEDDEDEEDEDEDVGDNHMRQTNRTQGTGNRFVSLLQPVATLQPHV